MCRPPSFTAKFLPKLLLLIVVPLAHAQQAPYYTTPKFDRQVIHRTNVCQRSKLLFQDDSITNVKEALQGLQLSVGLVDYTGTNEELLSKLSPDGTLPPSDSGGDYPGLLVVIMDELARRAGFTWRDTYGIIAPLSSATDGNNTWTDILDWSVDVYDISVDYWSKSAERVDTGVGFPHGWYDASIIIVERNSKILERGQKNAKTNSFQMWSFLEPFDGYVWLLIFISIVVTGLLYQLLDSMNEFADYRKLGKKPLASIFFAAIVFTTHFEFKPNTAPAMLVSWSWSFWALIVSAAYTANLASFLIDSNTPHVFYTSIDEVVGRGVKMCIKTGTNQHLYVANKYPFADIVEFDREREIYDGLRNGQCGVAITQRSTFDAFERDVKVNYDCSLESVARSVRPLAGGFANAIDTGSKCTSLISFVLDFHLVAMEGFLEDAYADYLRRKSANLCKNKIDPENLQQQEEDQANNMRLDLRDMGGIFCFHYILTAVAFALAMIDFLPKKKREKTGENEDLAQRQHTEGDDSNEDSNEADDDQFDENEILDLSNIERAANSFATKEKRNSLTRGRSQSVWASSH